MKADTSPSPAKIANTMPYVYSIVKTQKAVCNPTMIISALPTIEMSSFSQSRHVQFRFSPPSLVFVAPAAGVGATDDSASA